MAVEVKPGAVPGANDGNLLILAEVDPNTFALKTLVTGSTLVNLGGIANSDVTQDAAKTEKRTEDSEVCKTSFVYTRMTKGVLVQEDADLLDFLADTVKGKRFLEIKYNGYINSLYQYYLKLVEVVPAINIHRSGEASTLNYESTGVRVPATVSYTSTSLLSIAALLTLSNFCSVAFDITLAKQYKLIER